MIWTPPPEPARRSLSGRHKGMVWTGGLLALVGLAWVAVMAVQVAARVGSPLGQSLSSPSYATPVDLALPLERSEYTVFELTGQTSGGGGITFTERRSPTLVPQDVRVTGPDGAVLPVRGAGGGTETLNRGREIYTAAVYFTVPEAGSFHVRVDSGEALRVVIARSMASGFHGVRADLRYLPVAILLLVLGLAGCVAALWGARARSASTAVPRTGPDSGVSGQAVQVTRPQPVPGWYPDPDDPRQWRWWDGAAWAPANRDRPRPGGE